MGPISFSFSMLNVDWESHHDGTAQIDSSVNQFNGAELHITNPDVHQSARGNIAPRDTVRTP